MKAIPLNILTLYADLAQQLGLRDVRPGSISTKTVDGRRYLYAVEKDGRSRIQRFLGPADSPEAREQAARIRRAEIQAKGMRSTVAALKQARVPAPTLALGRILEVISNAGLFEQGIVLIGTAAYQTYACILGRYLPAAAITTSDADLLVASFVGGREPQDMEAILRRADPTFRAHMQLGDRLPKVFEADNNFSVDILTKFGRGRKSPILFKELGCSAEALPFMEYLAEESMEAVALYGTGVLVPVPPPLRFAAHKLLIAQERRGRFAAKKPKDLAQARDLIEIFLETDSFDWEGTLEEARGRGPKWKRNIDASLREIGRRSDGS